MEQGVSDWRTKALELLPELAGKLAESDTPMHFWLEVCSAFEDAYEEPRNEDFIRRVYQFAGWCLAQDSDEDAENHLPTCVLVCFYKHIPTIPGAREDMPRWFDRKDVVLMKEVFTYHTSEKDFQALLTLFRSPAPDKEKSTQKRGRKQRR